MGLIIIIFFMSLFFGLKGHFFFFFLRDGAILILLSQIAELGSYINTIDFFFSKFREVIAPKPMNGSVPMLDCNWLLITFTLMHKIFSIIHNLPLDQL